mgnify:CR=1 FL=1
MFFLSHHVFLQFDVHFGNLPIMSDDLLSSTMNNDVARDATKIYSRMLYHVKLKEEEEANTYVPFLIHVPQSKHANESDFSEMQVHPLE